MISDYSCCAELLLLLSWSKAKDFRVADKSSKLAPYENKGVLIEGFRLLRVSPGQEKVRGQAPELAMTA